MIKVKGQISDVALCVVEPQERIASMARMLFQELAKKVRCDLDVCDYLISILTSISLVVVRETPSITFFQTSSVDCQILKWELQKRNFSQYSSKASYFVVVLLVLKSRDEINCWMDGWLHGTVSRTSCMTNWLMPDFYFSVDFSYPSFRKINSLKIWLINFVRDSNARGKVPWIIFVVLICIMSQSCWGLLYVDA